MTLKLKNNTSFTDGVEGGSFSKCGSRPSTAHIFQELQELHGLRAGRFQNVVLALAPRTFVLSICKSFTD
eukprot:9120887-Pyramimonas_sp.AAC.1